MMQRTINPFIYARLKASTLVEVLVALVIITLVVAIAATLYVKMSWKRPDNLVNLQLELKTLAQETKRNRDFTFAQYQIGNDILIDKQTEAYKGDTLLILLELRAHKRGTGEEAIYREIIINDQL